MLSTIFFLFSAFVLLVYISLILYFSFGYSKIKSSKAGESGNVKISILVAFRNEEENLPNLIDCLSNQTMPREAFEILFINDHSTDESENIILKYIKNQENINVTLLQLNETTGKKNAISKAVIAAKHNWIVTIDADMTVEPNWLDHISKVLYLESPDMLILPVKIAAGKTFFTNLQAVEFIFLSGITSAAAELKNPFLCNGANLAFNKDVFLNANPFDGNLQIASGDDLFLLQKIKEKFEHKIIWSNQKSSIATTEPKKKLAEFISQRIRWAGKTKAVKSRLNSFTAGFVFLVSINTIFILTTCFFELSYLKFAASFYLLKIGVELLFFLQVSSFYGAKKKWWWVILLQPVYCFYIIFIGSMSIFATTTWKGRKIKNI